MQIVITVRKAARTGYFEVWLGERQLLANAWVPFCEAALMLVKEGADPSATLIMRWEGADHDALRGRLDVAAKLTVAESFQGPIFRKPIVRKEGPKNDAQATAH